MRTILIAGVIFLLPSFSYAFDFFPNLASTREVTAADPAQCMDFSGVWKGTCQATSPNTTQTYESKMTMHQYGCDVIVADNQLVDIGSTKTSVTSAKGRNSADVMTVDWNTEKTELVIHQTSLSRNDLMNNGQLTTFVMDGKMKRVDKKLTMTGSGSNSMTLVCSLDLQ